MDLFRHKKGLFITLALLIFTGTGTGTGMAQSNSYINLSQDLLYAIRTADSTKFLIADLESASLKDLASELNSDNKKKVFWINIYNAFTIYKIQKDEDAYKHRQSFFKSRDIVIAGHVFSLNDIEHGILRRSKIWWSMGYLKNSFPDKAEKLLRVDELDPRIHFALNCGAKSCPPIAFYEVPLIEEQLEMATKGFLQNETTFNIESNIATTSKILSWFRGDFGGKKGVKKWLKEYGALPANATPKLKFNNYDWSIYISNFRD